MEPPGVFAPLKLLFKLSILHSMVACVSSAKRLILWVSGTDDLSEKVGKKNSRDGGTGTATCNGLASHPGRVAEFLDSLC